MIIFVERELAAAKKALVSQRKEEEDSVLTEIPGKTKMVAI